MMMMSEPFSTPWLFGLFINIIQVTLFLIFLQMLVGTYLGFSKAFVKGRFNFSDLSTNEERLHMLAKYISTILIFFFQTDLIEAIRSLYTDLRFGSGKWRILIECDGSDENMTNQDERLLWLKRIMIPLALKLFEGLLGFFVCVMFVVLSNSIIDLYKDFASLLIVSELDDKAFWLAQNGFFGDECQRKSSQVSKTNIPDFFLRRASSMGKEKSKWPKYSRGLLLLSAMSIVFVLLGDTGVFLRLDDDYRQCYVPFPIQIGDGTCNYGKYNTKECKYDGGDCKNSKDYPHCYVKDPSLIGNGICDGDGYNTTDCDFDGNDCLRGPREEYPLCFVRHPKLINDGHCDYDKDGYNTVDCGFDGGDCLPKNATEKGYPDCFVFDIKLLGDGICHSSFPGYNSTECGFDDGDCLVLESKELPGCFVKNPNLLADGICHDFLENYNTPKCGYDGGDCLCENFNDDTEQNPACVDGLVNGDLEGFPYCFVYPDEKKLLGDRYCDANDNPSINIGVCNYDGGDCIIDSLPGCHAFYPPFLGNGMCNDAYIGHNTLECNFDDGDCKPIEAEGFPGCFVHRPDLLGDGVCNIDYPGMNTTECNFDGGDCAVSRVYGEGYENCFVSDVSLIANGICNAEYDSEDCQYDGGDCKLKEVKALHRYIDKDPNIDCEVTNPELISDGVCNWDLQNYYTFECGFDGGDCFLIEVPGFKGCFASKPELIGDGICHREYNSASCGYDGGDCNIKPVEGYPDCFAEYPEWIGDLFCDSIYNTTECGYDDGECIIREVDGYPGCFAPLGWIGDEYCDGDLYNTTECAYDGGDCLMEPTDSPSSPPTQRATTFEPTDSLSPPPTQRATTLELSSFPPSENANSANDE